MPIVFAPLNEELIITKVSLDEKTKKRLESLGILVNAKINILSSIGGNVIVLIKSSRLAIDKNIATKIFVRREAQ